MPSIGIARKAPVRPHTPTDNGIIERYHRTIGEQIDQQELSAFAEAQRAIGEIIDHYNHHRLHAALSYLRPVDDYRGNPDALLAARRRKLFTAGEYRKQANLKLRQGLNPPAERENRPLSKRPNCLTLSETFHCRRRGAIEFQLESIEQWHGTQNIQNFAADIRELPIGNPGTWQVAEFPLRNFRQVLARKTVKRITFAVNERLIGGKSPSVVWDVSEIELV